jgi:integral membrane protein
MTAALKRFRIMAWIVGVMLLLLAFVAMPLKYIWDMPTMVAVIGPIHGFLYIVYVVVAFDLAMRAKWSMTRTILVLLAGTIPVMSFVAERKVVSWLREPSAATT